MPCTHSSTGKKHIQMYTIVCIIMHLWFIINVFKIKHIEISFKSINWTHDMYVTLLLPFTPIRSNRKRSILIVEVKPTNEILLLNL